MGLRLEICQECHLHGRFVGDNGLPMEVGSREMAKAMLTQADFSGVLGPGDMGRIDAAIAASMMAVKEAWIEDALRIRLQLWNLAVGTTNDPEAFGKTDFHAYHKLVDGFGHDDDTAA